MQHELTSEQIEEIGTAIDNACGGYLTQPECDRAALAAYAVCEGIAMRKALEIVRTASCEPYGDIWEQACAHIEREFISIIPKGQSHDR